jgi:hypothetical protein
MIDPALAGTRGTPFEIRIEWGKVREFARSIGASLEPGEAPTVPPTFLTTMFWWEREVDGADVWPLVGMDPKRGMHAEQEYVFHGPPPRAGDRLIATSRIDRIWQKVGKRGGTLTFVDLVTEFRDPEGKLVAEAKMTAVETEKPPEAP